MTAGLDIASYLEGTREVERHWTLPIAHLSASSLGMLARCPEQWRQRYVLGKKERPGEALVIGTAVHLCAERNFVQKIESKQDIPTTELVTWFDDVGFPQALQERQEKGEEVAWDTGPDSARMRGRTITYAYNEAVAPRVQPLAAESRVEADFGLPVPVIGYADCVTTGSVIDIKTGKAARRDVKPEWRIQAAVYSTITGLPVDFHAVAASEKTFKATIMTPLESPGLSVWLPEEAREETQRNVRAMAWMAHHFMDTLGPDAAWPTTGQVHPWACNWCAFKPGCPAWKGIPL
jgi:PD-(D/E)XK nuclease superfamily